MEGFTFFNLNNEDPDPRKADFVRQEAVFFTSVKESIQSGAGLSRILQHRKEADLVFISAFRTGDNPSEGGYGFYKDGEVDSLGNAHKDGEAVSRNENQRRSKSLAQEIKRLGYGFVKVEGHYDGKVEESYCVINYKENTQDFIQNLSQLANKFGQDSILVAPKGVSAFFYSFDGSKDVLKNDLSVLEDAVKNYTSVKGHHFAFSVLDVGGRDSLSPIRGGMKVLIPTGSRKELLQERNTNHLLKLMR